MPRVLTTWDPLSKAMAKSYLEWGFVFFFETKYNVTKRLVTETKQSVQIGLISKRRPLGASKCSLPPTLQQHRNEKFGGGGR